MRSDGGAFDEAGVSLFCPACRSFMELLNEDKRLGSRFAAFTSTSSFINVNDVE